jgi:HPt (histidine-containing phosphotransfer) domain-containing protein
MSATAISANATSSPAFMAADSAPSFERPVDLVHLARQTLGDRALEREVLELFKVQARAIFAQLEAVSETHLRHDLAHTLKGSARAVGAWKVAEAAEACEQAQDWNAALGDLAGRIEIALQAIEELIRH